MILNENVKFEYYSKKEFFDYFFKNILALVGSVTVGF